VPWQLPLKVEKMNDLENKLPNETIPDIIRGSSMYGEFADYKSLKEWKVNHYKMNGALCKDLERLHPTAN